MFRHFLILSVGLLLAGNALADEALLRKSGCLACHTVDKKLVGPALKDIAAKYKGVPGAVATLAKKVRAGGSGNWGTGGDGTCTRDRERCGSQGGDRLHPYPQIRRRPHSKQAGIKPACFVNAGNAQMLTSGRASSPRHRPVSASFHCRPGPIIPLSICWSCKCSCNFFMYDGHFVLGDLAVLVRIDLVEMLE